MSRRSQFGLGAGLAVFLVWLFLRQADLDRVGRTLAAADPWLLALVVLLTLFTSVQRAWRWRQLLAPLARVPMRPLLDCILMGWAVSVLLPGRLGEVARPVLLSRRSEVSASAGFGSVVLERVFDAATVLVLLAGYLAFLPPPVTVTDEGRLALDAMRTSGLAALVALLLGGVVSVLAMRSGRFRGRLEVGLMRLMPRRLGAVAVAFVEGMSGLRSPWLLARIAVSSLLLWSTILFCYVVLFHALHVDLPWYAAIPVLVLLVVGVMVPTPGAVGSFHKAAQVGLVGLWGVDNDLAVAYAIASHAVAFLPLGALGLALLVREGLSPAALGGLRTPTDVAGESGAGEQQDGDADAGAV